MPWSDDVVQENLNLSRDDFDPATFAEIENFIENLVASGLNDADKESEFKRFQLDMIKKHGNKGRKVSITARLVNLTRRNLFKTILVDLVPTLFDLNDLIDNYASYRRSGPGPHRYFDDDWACALASNDWFFKELHVIWLADIDSQAPPCGTGSRAGSEPCLSCRPSILGLPTAMSGSASSLHSSGDSTYVQVSVRPSGEEFMPTILEGHHFYWRRDGGRTRPRRDVGSARCDGCSSGGCLEYLSRGVRTRHLIGSSFFDTLEICVVR
jgi:DNA-binding phage protein